MKTMAERTKGSVVFKYLPEDFIVEERGLEEKYECKISASQDVFTEDSLNRVTCSVNPLEPINFNTSRLLHSQWY